MNLEILSSSPLLVCEGGHVLVTSDNIAMVLDIAKYGVEEDGVIFTLITPPTYGTLTLDLLTTRTEHSFTLRDIDRSISKSSSRGGRSISLKKQSTFTIKVLEKDTHSHLYLHSYIIIVRDGGKA